MYLRLLFLISSCLASAVDPTLLKARPMGQIKVVGPGYSLWTTNLEACVKYCDSSDQCDAINYHSSTHKCRLFAPCTHVYSMYGSLDYYFYSKRPQILDHGFVFDKDRDTCIKLMEIDSDMSQGDKVCTRLNGRLLTLSGPSTQDIAVKLMIRARDRPKYVWTGGGESWDWNADFTRSSYTPSYQDPRGLDTNPPLCSVLEITGQWLKVPCDQGNYMSLCEVPAFYTLVKPAYHPLFPPTTISYPTVSFPSYDALTPPPGTYPSPYDGPNLQPPNFSPNSDSFPPSPNSYPGIPPYWGNANPPYLPPPGYVPPHGSPGFPPYDSGVPRYPAENYPSQGYPGTLAPPTYPPPPNYPSYRPPAPPPNYPAYPPSPPVISPPAQPPPTYPPPTNYPPYVPPVTSPPPLPPSNYPVHPTSPPATYGSPQPPPTYSPPSTYRPPANYPTYVPPVTSPPANYPTYAPPRTSPPAPPPPPNYPVHPTPPPATYGPPALPPPTYPPQSSPAPPPKYPAYPTTPPGTSPPPPATYPPSPPPYTYPPPQYQPSLPFPPSTQPSLYPSPPHATYPFYQLPGGPHIHFSVPQKPPYGYFTPTQGAFQPSFTQFPDIYYHRPPVAYNPNAYPIRPDCAPGYDCKTTTPLLPVSTFSPAINPYFPPLLIYQPGYQDFPQTTPHYKGYIPPGAHPTNIPYRPFTDFDEKPPFQGRTYIVKGDMAYEIPTEQHHHGWDRDYILNGRSVDYFNNETNMIGPNKTEQLKSNETSVPSPNKHTNEGTFYYSKSNYLSNADTLPRDAKNTSGGNRPVPSNTNTSNTTVINSNSTFSTNVEYTKSIKSPNLATIEIQGGGIVRKIMPNESKRFGNNTAVMTPML